MPILEMKVPSPGESISEVEIAAWLVSDGDYVDKDQAIAEVDSDKATLELPAEAAGVITLKAEEGDVVPVGEVCCLIDTDAERPAGAPAPAPVAAAAPAPEAAPAPAPAAPAKAPAPAAPAPPKPAPSQGGSHVAGHASPAARKAMADAGLPAGSIQGSGREGRVLKQDVLAALAAGFDASNVRSGWEGSRDTRREKMSMLRRKVAERLVSVKERDGHVDHLQRGGHEAGDGLAQKAQRRVPRAVWRGPRVHGLFHQGRDHCLGGVPRHQCPNRRQGTHLPRLRRRVHCGELAQGLDGSGGAQRGDVEPRRDRSGNQASGHSRPRRGIDGG